MQREQIATLKVALEEAVLTRKRKLEYDQLAKQINALPSRTELEQFVTSKLAKNVELSII